MSSSPVFKKLLNDADGLMADQAHVNTMMLSAIDSLKERLDKLETQRKKAQIANI